MLENRKAYESTLDAQLAQWGADLDVLKAKAKQAEVQALVNYDKAIEALQHKHGEAGKHLHNLKLVSDEAWEGAKASTEKTWHELKALFQSCAGKP
jgi:hypothetical protein